ncbi:Bug family tripartite tricarboxylate transporter substrate binding protein [Allopusillimonas ginsengisoli]|uniref:Bug family tripartite tricarboxylate transporter substrate binding protein n=1 Tax=Allopusillimonas ginsengisoli TaxID=453575 RepID=UPI001020F97C|nr:tripartite tricarboxylate transporter substrate binding protein [Allopusillimonas ginsengisoli]TEA79752.1 tripartite tricarboxylate transporter substrate binding protein [Allopusillimonas ginsengisoli]
MKHLLRYFAISLAASGLLAMSPAWAAGFPNKPLRMVIPWPAGGLVDIVGRGVAEKMQQSLGVPIVVENKPGAGGVIGASDVARASPDGYTLLLTTSAMNMNAAIRSELPFDVETAFDPVAVAAYTSLILVTSPQGPASVKMLIEQARAKPGELTYASAGTGTPGHFAGEMLKAREGLDVVHVPYKGGPPAMIDQISGRVDYHFANAAVALPQIAAGKIKALAVASAQRIPQLPDVPTMAQAGIQDFDLDQWIGYLVPAGVSSEVLGKLNEAIVTAVSDEKLQASLVTNGMTAAQPRTAAQFKEYLHDDYARWKTIAKQANIQLD